MYGHHHRDESCFPGARLHHGGFGGFKLTFGRGGYPHGFGGPGNRARRGDVRAAVLRLLAESPMHGYQIIQELSSRSDGAWSPSAGSVYPTLQLLADEGLVIAEVTAGKKVFSLTDSGVELVAQTADQPAPWEDAAQGGAGSHGYRDAVGKLMPAVFQIGTSGSPEQIASAIDILNETRQKLYAILASS